MNANILAKHVVVVMHVNNYSYSRKCMCLVSFCMCVGLENMDYTTHAQEFLCTLENDLYADTSTDTPTDREYSNHGPAESPSCDIYGQPSANLNVPGESEANPYETPLSLLASK